ncbi:MAG: hypothetical protein ACODAE_08370, partial [Gemmatimonadota bacterium]
DAVQETGEAIRDTARDNVHDRDIAPTIRKRSEARGLNAKVTADHWRAHFEEFGTKPHIIEPRTKEALASLEGQVSFRGEDVFGPVARVRHPGQDARPYLHPAAEQERREFPRRLSSGTAEALQKVARSR